MPVAADSDGMAARDGNFLIFPIFERIAAPSRFLFRFHSADYCRSRPTHADQDHQRHDRQKRAALGSVMRTWPSAVILSISPESSSAFFGVARVFRRLLVAWRQSWVFRVHARSEDRHRPPYRRAPLWHCRARHTYLVLIPFQALVGRHFDLLRRRFVGCSSGRSGRIFSLGERSSRQASRRMSGSKRENAYASFNETGLCPQSLH